MSTYKQTCSETESVLETERPTAHKILILRTCAIFWCFCSRPSIVLQPKPNRYFEKVSRECGTMTWIMLHMVADIVLNRLVNNRDSSFASASPLSRSSTVMSVIRTDNETKRRTRIDARWITCSFLLSSKPTLMNRK